LSNLIVLKTFSIKNPTQTNPNLNPNKSNPDYKPNPSDIIFEKKTIGKKL